MTTATAGTQTPPVLLLDRSATFSAPLISLTATARIALPGLSSPPPQHILDSYNLLPAPRVPLTVDFRARGRLDADTIICSRLVRALGSGAEGWEWLYFLCLGLHVESSGSSARQKQGQVSGALTRNRLMSIAHSSTASVSYALDMPKTVFHPPPPNGTLLSLGLSFSTSMPAREFEDASDAPAHVMWEEVRWALNEAARSWRTKFPSVFAGQLFGEVWFVAVCSCRFEALTSQDLQFLASRLPFLSSIASSLSLIAQHSPSHLRPVCEEAVTDEVRAPPAQRQNCA